MTTTGEAWKNITQSRKVEAALVNEHLTRQRVDRLEHVSQLRDSWHSSLADEVKVLRRGFWGRFRWLFLGR